jgi:hypothetical protein
MKKILFGFIILLILIPITLYSFSNKLPFKNMFNLQNNKTVLSNQTKSNSGALNNPFGFPGGLDFAKGMNGGVDLGKNAFYYDYKPYNLAGDEWVATKKVNSEKEYQSLVSQFTNFYNLKVKKDGWVNELNVDLHNLQPIAAQSPAGRLYGFIKYRDAKIREILLYNQKDSLNYPTNVQFRVFLSDFKPLGEVVK